MASLDSPLAAVVAELVDAPDSGSGDSNIVGVRLSPTAQGSPGLAGAFRFPAGQALSGSRRRVALGAVGAGAVPAVPAGAQSLTDALTTRSALKVCWVAARCGLARRACI